MLKWPTMRSRKTNFFRDISSDYKLYFELAVYVPAVVLLGILGLLFMVLSVLLVVADVLLLFGSPIMAVISLFTSASVEGTVLWASGAPIALALSLLILPLRRYSVTVYNRYLNYFFPRPHQYAEREMRMLFRR